jgi:hypothetical protein
MQGYEITTIGVPIMVASHIRKVRPGFGKIYAHEIILRLRINDGYAICLAWRA